MQPNYYFEMIQNYGNVERDITTMSGSSASGASPSNKFAIGRVAMRNLQLLCDVEVNLNFLICMLFK